MRTNIVIDEKLMQDALRLSGLKTKREVVEESLKTLISLHEQQQARKNLLKLKGKLRWEGDLDAMRLD